MITKLLKMSLATLMITGMGLNAQVSNFSFDDFSFDVAGSTPGDGPAEAWTQTAGLVTTDEVYSSAPHSMKLPVEGNETAGAKLQTWRDGSTGKFDMMAANYTLSLKARVTGAYPSNLVVTYTNTGGDPTETVPLSFSLTSLTEDIWEPLILPFTASIAGTDCWFSLKFNGFPANADPEDTSDDGAVYIDDIVVTFASVLSSEISNPLDGVSIYPNPVAKNEFLNIECPKSSVVKLANISGVIVESIKTTSSNTSLNVSGLNSGIYIVKVISEGKTFVTKVVIQ